MSVGSTFDSTKEQVKRSIDIVELVGEYIPLRREGRNYKGLCPWHDDSHPSLHVNPERQTFHCFVCHIGGDIFSRNDCSTRRRPGPNNNFTSA